MTTGLRFFVGRGVGLGFPWIDDNIACDNGVIGLVDDDEADCLEFVDGSRVEVGIVDVDRLAVSLSMTFGFGLFKLVGWEVDFRRLCVVGIGELADLTASSIDR
jgi:hypothetical protein